jgi:two-component system response regulator DesR
VIRTLVAEHVHLLRIGLIAYLAHEPDIHVIAELQEDDQLTATASMLTPAVAVIDVDLPSGGGATAVSNLKQTQPDCAIVMLVGHDDAAGIGRAMAVKPLGLLSREASAGLLTRCVRRVAGGHRVVDPTLAGTVRSIVENPLTRREQEILRIAADGASTAEIADRLSLSSKTVRNHLSRVFIRIGARNRIDAIRIASEHDWF